MVRRQNRVFPVRKKVGAHRGNNCCKKRTQGRKSLPDHSCLKVIHQDSERFSHRRGPREWSTLGGLV